MSQTAIALPARTLLHHGQYRLERVLGQGGFGITYLAYDQNVGAAVAVKELFVAQSAQRSSNGSLLVSPEGQTDFLKVKERYRLEAQTLLRLRHPAIVRALNLFEANQTVYLVLEYLEGQTLEARLRAQGRLSEAEVRGWMVPLLNALNEVHATGLLHRDLKPENIMLTAQGPVLIDFGAALELASTQTRYTVMYTPTYAPLEQLGSGAKLLPATDLFGLCATAYRCLTGTTPTPASDRLNGAVLPSIQQFSPSVSSGLARLVEQGLALKVGERPQSAREMLESLQTLVPASDEPAVQGQPENTVLGQPMRQSLGDEGDWDNQSQAPKWQRLAPWLGLAGVAVAGLAMWAVLGRSPAQPAPVVAPKPQQVAPQTQPQPAPKPNPVLPLEDDLEAAPTGVPAPIAPVVPTNPVDADRVSLRLESNTPELQLVLDGQRLTVAKPQKVGNRYRYEVRLASGTQARRLEVRADGFQPYRGQLILSQSRNLLVLLERKSVWLRVYTNRPNAALWLNRQLVDGRAERSGSRYVLEVQRPFSAQASQVEVRATGYRAVRRQVVLNQERRLEMVLEPIPRPAPRPVAQPRVRPPKQPSTAPPKGGGCDLRAGAAFCR